MTIKTQGREAITEMTSQNRRQEFDHSNFDFLYLFDKSFRSREWTY
jgi:hypothetical protein